MAYIRVNWQNNISTPINATKLNIMDAGIDNHENRVVKNENDISNIINNRYDKLQSNKLKSVNMYFPYNTTDNPSYTVLIDKAVEVGCNCISLNPRLKMNTATSNTIVRYASDTDIVNAFTYAKSKGLKTIMKCHMYDFTGPAITPTDPVAWINSLKDNTLYYCDLLTDKIDIICLGNELVNQDIANTSTWQSFNDAVKAKNANYLTTYAAAGSPALAVSVLNGIVDILGCNTYIGVNATSSTSVIDARKQICNGYNKVNYVKQLSDLSMQFNKQIIITEVGCLPYWEMVKKPASWDPTGYTLDYAAQKLYFDVVLPLYLNAFMFYGISIWALQDGYSFIGHPAEDSIKLYYGGV